MLFDDVIERIKERQKKIVALEMEQQIDVQILNTSGAIDTDLISVRNAMEKYTFTRNQIENLMNSKKIHKRDIIGKIFLSKKEIETYLEQKK